MSFKIYIVAWKNARNFGIWVNVFIIPAILPFNIDFIEMTLYVGLILIRCVWLAFKYYLLKP